MYRYLALIVSFIALPLWAEQLQRDSLRQDQKRSVELVGSIQHDGLYAHKDAAIGADKPEFPYLSNTYLDVGIRSKYVSAGLRGEVLLAPMPGFDPTFKGAGVSHVFVKVQTKYGSLTIGDVYGQFGSGMILRLYEDRAIGLDNALRGAKLYLTPYKGIAIQVLGGKQRRYWEMYDDGAWGFNYRKDALIGADMELGLHEWIPAMQEKGANLTIGGSWVSKYQKEDTLIASSVIRDGYLYAQRYNLPEWVGAWDARVQFQMKGWNALVEYAYKANDPSYDNGLSYKPGQTLLVSLSYSRSGLAVLGQIKRSENMSFRSDRLGDNVAGKINYLPPFAQQHTYTLASLNSYVTQIAGGEWAFQGEVAYTWKRHTAMGGKYGTTLKLHATHIRGLEDTEYYTDVNVELHKKLTPEWTIHALLMYQGYNQFIVEGHGPLIRSGIAVAEAQWKVNKNVHLRAELQYLYSRQDEGQWLFALGEISLYRWFMLTLSDTYNIGGVEGASHNNYWSALAVFTHNAHRLSVGYERVMAGYNCSGGVCRYKPAHAGAVVSYTFTW